MFVLPWFFAEAVHLTCASDNKVLAARGLFLRLFWMVLHTTSCTTKILCEGLPSRTWDSCAVGWGSLPGVTLILFTLGAVPWGHGWEQQKNTCFYSGSMDNG